METFYCPHCKAPNVEYIVAGEAGDGDGGMQLVKCKSCKKRFWVTFEVHLNFDEPKTENEVRELYAKSNYWYDRLVEEQEMQGHGR